MLVSEIRRLFQVARERFPAGNRDLTMVSRSGGRILLAVVVLGFATSASAAVVNVGMRNFAFVPADVVIEQGDTVVWTNEEGIHTSTSGALRPDGLWDSGTLTAGQSFQRTFSNLGEFRYHCEFHWQLGMTGTVTVVPAGQGAADPMPSIRANGAVGSLSVSPSDPVSISLELVPGDGLGKPADWWVVALTPFGAFSFDPAVMFWVPGVVASLQAPLLQLPPISLPELTGLPAAAYAFYFGVDLVGNGVVDVDSLFFDVVEVNVTAE